ncbi:hypothetical protein [Acidaminobacterium chupaoyuni]
MPLNQKDEIINTAILKNTLYYIIQETKEKCQSNSGKQRKKQKFTVFSQIKARKNGRTDLQDRPDMLYRCGTAGKVKSAAF